MLKSILLVCFSSEQADVDGNGTLDYGEFVTVSIHLKKIGNDEHIRKAFSYFDQNQSGYIEIDELRVALVDDLGSDQEEVIDAIIRDVDTDKVSSATFDRISTFAPSVLEHSMWGKKFIQSVYICRNPRVTVHDWLDYHEAFVC